MKMLNKKQAGLWAILLMPFSLNASNVSFLKYAVIADFTEGDVTQLQQEYLQVLKENKPGDIHIWKNTKTENGGDITVIKQYKQKENGCKRLKFKNKSKTQSAVSYFNFCLIEKKWQLVN